MEDVETGAEIPTVSDLKQELKSTSSTSLVSSQVLGLEDIPGALSFSPGETVLLCIFQTFSYF